MDLDYCPSRPGSPTPFCWWVGVAVDHFSRRVMGFAVFRCQPASADVRSFLEQSSRDVGRQPRYLVTDRGRQFIEKTFRRWCRRGGIRQRFGAIGKYGSLAVIERCTLKNECTRRLIAVPYRVAEFEQELRLYVSWYNGYRPHTRVRDATPDEVYNGRHHASRAPRLETRPRWPRRSPCAAPHTLIRGQPGATTRLTVTHHGARQHLPIVTLRRAA